tara:strand:- start:42 stop:287 length:246 start_codon:yes stop_codon:yes gene_type:complete
MKTVIDQIVMQLKCHFSVLDVFILALVVVAMPQHLHALRHVHFDLVSALHLPCSMIFLGGDQLAQFFGAYFAAPDLYGRIG